MSGVPPIRFINLDRDAERRERLLAELARWQLAGERFPGVLWTALPLIEQDKLYSSALNVRQFHKPLVNGEKGCYASHLAVWQWLVDSDEDCCIVLEDDVRLTPQFRPACEAIAAIAPRWDMIKLIGRSGLGKTEKLRASQPLCKGVDLVDFRRVPSLTAGYAISRRGAQKLLASRLPFGRPIDVDLRHWWEGHGLRVQGLSPGVIELDETSLDSSIGAKPEARSLVAKWRKFRHKLQYSLGNAWHGAHR